VAKPRAASLDCLVYIIILLLGCLTSGAGFFVSRDWQSVVLSIGTSVIAAGVVSIAVRSLLGDPFSEVSGNITKVTQELTNSLQQTVTILDRSSKTGVVSIWANRYELPTEVFVQRIEQSRNQIDLLAYAMAFFPEHPLVVPLLKEKARAGCSIRILLGDPEGAMIARRSKEEEHEGSIQSRVEATLARLEHLVGLPGVEIKLHDTPLYCSIYRFDLRMLVTPHLYGVRGAAAPLLDIAKTEGGLFDKYCGHFEAIWSGAKHYRRAPLTPTGRPEKHRH
jgi:hypothetical protein